MRILSVAASTAMIVLIAGDRGAQAAISGTTLLSSGLGSPVFATFAPGDMNHMFVLEQGGNIRVVDVAAKALLTTPFLNIGDTDPSGEGGLMGMAFHPDYNKAGSTGFGKFYVYVTVDNGGLPVPAGTAGTATSPFSTHIRQYSVSSNPLVAIPTKTEIMSFPRPQDNHVGGWIGFSPKNGYLYINSGDGGSGNDFGDGHFEPGGNAQTLTDNLLGKQLRIDVNGDSFPSDPDQNYAIPASNPFVGIAGDDEIWSYGLRNPFRGSFDRDTGDQWMGDVGQNVREEIDFEPANRTAVSNFGWRLREGSIETPSVGGPAPANHVAPVYDYGHGTGTFEGNAVIGGYVYRGPDPSLQGTYFFADEISSHFWSMNTTTFAVTSIDGILTPDTGSLAGPASFAEDLVGNQYIVSYATGSVFRINTTQLLTGDFNADGTVNAADYVVLRKNAAPTSDFTLWRNNFGSTVHTSSPGTGSGVPEPAAVILWLAAFASVWVCHRCRGPALLK